MKRVDKLRKEYKNKNNDNNMIAENGTNPIDNNGYNKISVKDRNKNGNGQLQCQIAEEKEAAKIFPLNLISNRFKSNSNTLKGKLISYNQFACDSQITIYKL